MNRYWMQDAHEGPVEIRIMVWHGWRWHRLPKFRSATNVRVYLGVGGKNNMFKRCFSWAQLKTS
jgi:hypothetical protein